MTQPFPYDQLMALLGDELLFEPDGTVVEGSALATTAYVNKVFSGGFSGVVDGGTF